jgi:hypothetical protein
LLSHQNPVHILLLPIYATCPTLLLILDLITLIISGEEQKSQTHNYAVFSSPLTLFLVMSIFLSATLSNPEHMFSPHCEIPRFTPIQNKRQTYSHTHFHFCILNDHIANTKDSWWNGGRHSVKVICS